jgi:predicted cobalt transporter CbtA
MVAEILFINIPTLLVSAYVIYILIIQKSPYLKIVTIGLLIMTISGLAGVPFVEWLLENHWEWLKNSSYNMALSTVPLGIVSAVGFYICLSPLLKRAKDA